MDEKGHVYGFEKLKVWKNSRIFSTKIYKLSMNFPSDEKFGLISQIRRATVSVTANIAEGSSRFSKKDFARFVQISYGSLMEVLSHAYLAYDLKYMNNKELDDIKYEAYQISNQLNALHKSLN
ncbi:MAG: four helix bundle protein [Candidatus Marinimicrobia bacterium]|nr:four helix bundle protein [Candidatus Neomarinimicrobiota bacterium]